MTLRELEVLVKEIHSQVELNTLAINSLSTRFNSYTTSTTFDRLNSTVTTNSSDITTLKQQIAQLQSGASLVSKLSKLLDVNIQDLTKNYILQFDGDRWTNIDPSNITVEANPTTRIEDLSDVKISNKQDGQAICWDNASSKWINKTISTSGGGGSTGGLDVDAMWEELGKSSENQINPSHINGTLTISGLTVNGDTIIASGDNGLTISASKNEVKGNLIGLNEITAYGQV